jgi:hypothetical protein
MTKKLKQWWDDSQSNLWFVPVLCGVAFAAGFVELAGRIKDDLLRHYPRLFGAGADGSRGMLTTIATSITLIPNTHQQNHRHIHHQRARHHLPPGKFRRGESKRLIEHISDIHHHITCWLIQPDLCSSGAIS